MTAGGSNLGHAGPLYGLKFTGLDDGLFLTVLFGTTVYLAVHFVWSSIDAFSEWLLRITGSRVAFVTGAFFGNKHVDYPSDPRQSTLLNWWRGQALSIGIVEQKINEVIALVDTTAKSVAALGEGHDTAKLKRQVENNRNELIDIKGKIEAIKNTLASERIPASLATFESWFSLFLRSQNLRWLLIDFLLPMVLAGFAILLLGCRVFE